MEKSIFDLTMEQQFNIRSFKDNVKKMSHEQLQSFIVDLYKHMLIKENAYKQLIKNEWKL